jgi:hypothetical protein
VGADFAQRPEFDVGAAEVGAETETPDVGTPEVGAPDAEALGVGTLDVGWEAAAGELPGLAGRGGALAVGGGEAAGAGRAGGTVGIVDFETGLADVAERAGVMVDATVLAGVDVAGPEEGGVDAAAPDDACAMDDAAGGVDGRFASVDVAEAGLAAVAGRVAAEAPAAGVLAARADVAAVADAVVGAAADDADPGTAEADPGAELVLDARAEVAPVGVAAAFAWAGVRVAAAAWAEVGFVAGVDVLDAGGVGSAVEAVASGDLREPEADVEVAADAVASGAAESVGGIGASPEPRSPASSVGEAHVPEYAASAGAVAHEPELELEPAPDAFAAAFRAAGLAAWAGGSPGTAGIP